jgi:ribosomal protein S3AE
MLSLAKLDLSKNLKGKNLELKLRIIKEGEKLSCKAEKIELINSYVKKAIRSGADYVEDSFIIECRDSKARIKPLLVTRKRVSRSTLKILRETARKNLEGYLKTRNMEEIFTEIISNKLQKQLAQKLKKIYPLALCEIRMFEIIKE